MPIYADPQHGRRLAAAALEEWTATLVRGLGTPDDIAHDVAAVLVAADRRAIASHGTSRLPQYVALVEAGVVDPAARPGLEGGRPAFVRFNGQNGWGHHAGRVAMDAAIERASNFGVGVAVIRDANHFGIAGWYALRAAAHGLIGLSFTNTSPLVAPTRARRPLIGTNPIAVAAPAGRHDVFCLDMATSTVPRGRIEVAARRGEKLLPGWAIDAGGHPALDPTAALEGALQPLGGGEETGGYKGYGLALAVDLLTGVLAGARFGPNIVGLFSTKDRSDLGQAHIAIDPAAIDEPGAFEARLETYIDQLVAAETIPNAPGRVLIPGEPETDAERRADAHGVVIDVEHERALLALAQHYGLPLPSPQLEERSDAYGGGATR